MALGRDVVRAGVVTRVGVVGTVLAARGRVTFDRLVGRVLLWADLEGLARLGRGPADFARGLALDCVVRVARLLDERDDLDFPVDGLARFLGDALRAALDELRFGGAPANAVAPTSEVTAKNAPNSQVRDLYDCFIRHPQST